MLVSEKEKHGVQIHYRRNLVVFFSTVCRIPVFYLCSSCKQVGNHTFRLDCNLKDKSVQSQLPPPPSGDKYGGVKISLPMPSLQNLFCDT